MTSTPLPGPRQDDSLYRMLVQNVTDFAIYLLSPEGIVTNWNAGAERAKGYRPDEIIGHHFSRFYLDEDREAGLPERALATARTNGTFEDEGWRVKKDGSRLRAHVVIDPVYDERGILIGFAKITRDISAQYESKRAFERQTRNFQLLAQGVTDHAIYMLDPAGLIADWNAGAQRIKGYDEAEIVGRHFSIFHTQGDRDAGLPFRALATAMAHGRFAAEGWRVRRDGTQFWASVTIEPVFDDQGAHIGFSKLTRDLTEHKSRVDQIQTMRDNLDLALAHMSQGLCLFDRRERLVVCNDRFRELLAISHDEFRPGATFTDLLWLMHAPGTAGSAQAIDRVSKALGDHRAAKHDARFEQARELEIHDRILTISDRRLPDGGWVSTIDDVTERRNMEREVNHLALHDVLTNLPNRAAFQARLKTALGQKGRTGFCAVIYIDLDRFKAINDTFGHAAGDDLLRKTANALSRAIRIQDCVARLGGDEFVVLCTDLYEESDAIELAERLTRDLARPVVINRETVMLGASVGIAIAPPGETDADLLVQQADLAMYSAKDSGRGRCVRYQNGMREAMQERHMLEADLRHALETESFHLVYQPVMDTQARRVTSCETLLRWNHPTRGAIPPVEFIPFAEEIGLMPGIDDWVLRQACREATGWASDIAVSVNISASRLHQPGFAETVAAILVDTGLPATRLEIEITETSMITDPRVANTVLTELRSRGVQIAMDDFGTGYSSLSFLRDIPFTRIKIDRSFVQDLDRSPESTAIVRAVADICASLDLHVTAEGVETHDQAERLRREGCFEHQGYLISRPCPAAELAIWVQPAANDTIAVVPDDTALLEAMQAE